MRGNISAKTGTVSGTVKDAQSGETLIGAFVESKEDTLNISPPV